MREQEKFFNSKTQILSIEREKWLPNFKRKGWKTPSGKPVLNQDLWRALDHPELPKIKLQYVKGHSGEKDNDRVDEIAVAFSKGRKIKLKDFVKK